ncbi:Tn3 family transposase [Microbispora sp. NPDC046933]|uniref:Tn3 family transposase n=1 Tax=Microbispora sp. NPDC046933 TaxID=3155618 RepID=UPI0033C7F1CC
MQPQHPQFLFFAPVGGELSALAELDVVVDAVVVLHHVPWSESWNAGNSITYFGKGGDIPGNRRDEQELSVLCLRVLQAAVVYLNTLVIQDVLDEGLVALSADDQRGLTPLFWSNIAPYGEVRLNMNNRLALSATTPPPAGGDDDPELPPTTTEGQPR